MHSTGHIARFVKFLEFFPNHLHQFYGVGIAFLLVKNTKDMIRYDQVEEMDDVYMVFDIRFYKVICVFA